MNSEEAAFREIIRANPNDDVARLVYADWLDDRDDERAPFIRGPRPGVDDERLSYENYQRIICRYPSDANLRRRCAAYLRQRNQANDAQIARFIECQLLLDTRPTPLEEDQPIRDEANQILHANRAMLTPKLPKEVLYPKHAGGFLSEISVRWDEYVKLAGQLSELAPIRTVNFLPSGSMITPMQSAMDAMPETVEAIGVENLPLTQDNPRGLPYMQVLLRLLAKKPHIHALNVSQSELGTHPDCVQWLERINEMPNITSLDISHNALHSHEHLEAITRLTHLRHLNMRANALCYNLMQQQQSWRDDQYVPISPAVVINRLASSLPLLESLVIQDDNNFVAQFDAGLREAYRETICTDGATPSMVNLHYINIPHQINSVRLPEETENLRLQALAAYIAHEQQLPTPTLLTVEELNELSARLQER